MEENSQLLEMTADIVSAYVGNNNVQATHLRTKYDMSPEDYRAKWGLAKDYPMVAPNYAKARSDLAKQMGLGQGGRKPARGVRAKK